MKILWTVKELIEELKKHDGDLEVGLNTMECIHPIAEVSVEKDGTVVIQPFN